MAKDRFSGQPMGVLQQIRDNPDPLPTAIICDHDAEGRATLERYLGMETIPAYKAVTAGIQAVAARLGRRADNSEGLPELPARLFFCYDAQIHRRDDALDEAKKPASTEEEFDAYIWDTSASRKKGEEPVKDNDHGMDATRYLVAYADNIRVGAAADEHWDVY